MATLGQMAGGVGHEIKTPLAIIKMRIEQMEDSLGMGSLEARELTDGFTVVRKTVERIAKIVNGLKFFAREGRHVTPQKMKVSHLIDETLSFCREKFDSHGVRLDLLKNDAYHSAGIECRSVEISQVLLNLLNNAYDAVEMKEEKWIRVEVLDTGEFTEFSVTDSGAG